MALNARYFRLEQRDALRQFVLRIRGQVFASELAGGVPFGPWQVFVIHSLQHRKQVRLLSMRFAGICSSKAGVVHMRHYTEGACSA